MRVSWALNLSGDRPVRLKKWEPSQKGWRERKKVRDPTPPAEAGQGWEKQHTGLRAQTPK